MNLKETKFNHIGLIPINWDVVRLKDIAQINKGSVFDEKLASVDGIYPYINGGIYPSDWSNHFNTKENTIAVSEGGASAGYTQFMTTKYWAGSHCYKIQSKNKMSDNKYLFYVLKGFEKYLMIEKTGSAMPNLQKTKFINYLVSFVNDIEEQNKIVTFLDTETSKIDRKISILEQKYEKLEEYKQSVIFETVTKGLDKNVELKDSGIDWIGEIPKGWEVKRVKDFYKLGMGQTILKEDLIDDGKYPVYSATAEDKFFGYVNKINNPLNIGDLVIPARGNSIGHVKLVKETVVCTQTTIYMKQKSKIDSNFVYYYLLGNKPQLFFFDDTAIPQITVEQINGRLILVPSSPEQKEIVIFLNDLCSKIDKKVEIIKKQIELLKEYKQTIIYEAVTGKMEIL